MSGIEHMQSSFPGFRRIETSTLARLALAAALAVFLAACQENTGLGGDRAYRPLAPETIALMNEKGTTKSAPMLIRTFKKEAEFEIWKMKADGRYALLKTFPMCRWSGQLGPKTREGDRQVPEGFYAITPGQMNPNSNYYLSFNVGYPNAYDRAYGRDGGAIMVHGACSSAGCFSMTDQQIAEIYAIARESFSGGQKSIQMESLPFRMTADNLAKHRLDPNMDFWKQLKEGSDHFEVAKFEPKVNVCGRRYVFDASPANPVQQFNANNICPPLARDAGLQSEVAAKQRHDDTAVAELVAKGVKPVRVMYADGGMHPDFAGRIAETSRPDAVAQGPVEIALDEGRGRKSPLLQQAALKLPAAPVVAMPALAGQTIVPAQAAALPEAAGSPLLPVVEQAPATAFYQRWLGMTPADPKPAFVAPVEQATPVPANVPLPPRRQPAGVKSASKPALSPQAALQQIIKGAPDVVPAGMRAYAPVE